ncbi:hypothetical protein GH714_043781 [Hevea brasiliensis]|uniref:Myeloid leukemia factor n=1 Tax=Hevea brasiliensis TaxID=3981 RepID=A0A6A6K1G3_HEVBR|nr:hypothetical protein GH714_043781 [Hevea brasiliensis]
MGDPFGNFRGFGMMPSLFGGRDPFDDPFFTHPFRSKFSSSFTCDALHANGTKAVVVEELISDDEGEKEKDMHIGSGEEPSIEHPEEDLEDLAEKKSKNVNHRHDYNNIEGTKPQAHNFSFQTCKVTYGGVDGAYYTSTKTRRAGNDGGHSITRKLNPDGKVDTMQTLHNLNEDELAGFEEAWNGNVKGKWLGSSNQFDFNGSSTSEQKEMATWGGWALPTVQNPRNTGATSAGKGKKVIRINIE